MKNNIFTKILSMVVLLFIITGCTGNAATASSWPGFRVQDEEGYVSYGSQVFAIDLKNGGLLWQYPAEIDRNRQIYAAPGVSDSLVTIGDYANTIVGVDRETGVQAWRFDQADDRFIAGNIQTEDMVFAPNSDNHIYALDTAGTLKWRFKTEGPNWTIPVLNGENVYFASMDHRLYALKQSYQSNELVMDKDGSKTLVADPLWQVDLDYAITANPVLQDNIVYIATIEGALYAVETENGDILWTYNAEGEMNAVWSAPVILNNVIYVGDESGKIFTVNTSDGSPVWSTPFNATGAIVGNAGHNGELVFFSTTAGKIISIGEDKEPKTITNFEDVVLYSSVEISNDKIIFAPGDNEAYLSAYDFNGNEIWTFAPKEK